jgi:hypothetical protein
MRRQAPSKQPAESALSLAARVASIAAVAAACVFVLLLSVRLVNSSDLGYHLAYGEHFFATGQIVDTCPFIYTLSEGPPLVDRSKIGPGCWYDREGTYHFANANWLSQLVMTILYRWGGIAAMSLMVTACVGALLALSLLMMRRLEVPWTWAAAGVLVMALAAQARFAPRPEILGYVLLLAQLYLLLAPLREVSKPQDAAAWRPRGAGVLRVRAMVGLVALQVLMVNVHSYFLLSLAMTFSVLADQALRAAWQRVRRHGDSSAGQRALRNVGRVGIVLGGQTAACLVNPWTWRLALLPVQTLVFLKDNDITATKFPGPTHPWAVIVEITNTLSAISLVNLNRMDCAILLLLGLAGVGCLAALARRQWGTGLILAGMGGVALSMLRNAAAVSFLIIPAAFYAVMPAVRRLANRLSAAGRNWVTLVAAVLICLPSAFWSYGIVTNRLYQDCGSAERFGLGISRLRVPLDASNWLNENQPVGRMWTDFNLSSNLHYFTRPHRDVPVLTNTWAYPPDVMRMVLDYVAGLNFEDMRRRYDIEIVAVENGVTAYPLVQALAHDPNWAITYLSPCHVIFLWRQGPNAELARQCEITPENLDIQAYRRQIAQLDPVPEQAVFTAGMGFYRMKWEEQAIPLLEETIPERKPDHQELNMLGVCYIRRAVRRLKAGDSAGLDDLVKARQCFEKALRLKPDYDKGLQNLSLVRQQMESLREGVLLVPEE